MNSTRFGKTDRRRHGRTGEPTRQQLIARLVGTYKEMPGLRLRAEQAVRLFGVEATTCAAVLRDLVDDGFLRLTHDGQFALAD